MGSCCSCLNSDDRSDENQPLLAENEREAITELLRYLENRTEIDFFGPGPLRALSTLVYSDNLDLQRSAALAFAEITEKDVKAVGKEVFDPILLLLQSSDPEVQRAACAALGNLAVNNDNKVLIVQMGGLDPLIRQMESQNTEVQCNAVGCITNLATQDDNKAKIAKSGALVPLTRLAKNKDLRVQRNATGALLNMTHSLENRKELVNAGAVPVLVSLLSSTDQDVQYYCTTALSNIAVDEINRKKLFQTESRLVSQLVELMDSPSSRVQCQATLALRNLASDPSYQLEIVRAGGLPHLVTLLKSTQQPLILAAVACIRNISIHPMNEALIIDAGFLKPLVDLLDYKGSEEIQCHSVSTLRNLAASSEKNRSALLEAGAVQKCKNLVLQTQGSVLSEISACFAILALADDLKQKLLDLNLVDVLIPLTFSNYDEVRGNSAAALANLCSRIPDYSYIIKDWHQPNDGISGFLIRFLISENNTFEHIALWTLLQLLESGDPEIHRLIKTNGKIMDGVKALNFSTSELLSNEKTKEMSGMAHIQPDDSRYDVYHLTEQILQSIS
ncbi:protein anchor VAC8 [Ascoidea rubescens DSM 1968]|uniref:Vacuolar protein 8 n=1 Tax=Ascoidea rubescens DSM 1968 TaxID=1344418 RepID=A0A1D2VDN8_9ASCO|nr:ARM repeat-containing protein [Ascoidea rubescens DSM 1968]ODV59746.1 ARM repeat-containing protein [Ascoidea rubescens DSM 1968]